MALVHLYAYGAGDCWLFVREWTGGNTRPTLPSNLRDYNHYEFLDTHDNTDTSDSIHHDPNITNFPFDPTSAKTAIEYRKYVATVDV